MTASLQLGLLASSGFGDANKEPLYPGFYLSKDQVAQSSLPLFSIKKKSRQRRITKWKPETKFAATPLPPTPAIVLLCGEGAAVGFHFGRLTPNPSESPGSSRVPGARPALPSGPVKMSGAHLIFLAALLDLGDGIITAGRQLCALGIFIFK